MIHQVDLEQERKALLGLTEESDNAERKRIVFEQVMKLRCLSLSTMSVDGTAVHSRIIGFYLQSDGNLYFGTVLGKRLYRELEHNPKVTIAGTFYDDNPLRAYGIVIDAVAKPVTDESMLQEYWGPNPGSAEAYAEGMELPRIFYLASGQGEIFHVYSAKHGARLRFGFGGEVPRPPYYKITDKCIRCGKCADACLTGTIRKAEHGYYIRHIGCSECGKCYFTCPVNAIEYFG